MATGPTLPGRLTQFFDYYRKTLSRAELQVEREVFGANWGITSYTTPAQAHLLAKALELGPRTRVLDVGAGAGWPGVYLSERTGCTAVLTDIPSSAMRNASAKAYRAGVARACAFAVASGTHLPFRQRSFDAALHTDVL